MKMKKTLHGMFALLAASSLALVGCSGSTDKAAEKTPAAETTGTVTITDAHGSHEVPKNPKSLVMLDNRTFQTLEDWGVQPVAVPKDVFPKDSKFVKDEKIADIGNHREPNFEAITAANPDLIIVGQRFAQHYDKIKAAAPNSAIIDFNIELPKEATDADAAQSGTKLVDGLKKDTTALGQIFGKEKEASDLNTAFDKAVADAKEAYTPGQKVLAINTNGGKMGYLSPHVGRTLGPLYDLIGFTPAISVEQGTANHKGDEVSVETLAEANPDWILIMDREAAVGKGDVKSGAALVKDSEAMANVEAVKKDQILTMPADTYVNEGIQTYMTFLKQLTEAFNKAK